MPIGDRIGKLAKRRPLQEGITGAKRLRNKLPVHPVHAVAKAYRSAHERFREAKRSVRGLRH